LRGEATTAELCRRHQLSDTVISRWKIQLVKSAHQVFAAATPDDAQRERIDDLERLIGRLTVELDAAKKTLRDAPLTLDPRQGNMAVSPTLRTLRKNPGRETRRASKRETP
jgi:transposase